MPVRMPGQAFRRRAGMLGVLAGVCCSPFGPPAALRQGDHPSAGERQLCAWHVVRRASAQRFTDDVETLVNRWYTT